MARICILLIAALAGLVCTTAKTVEYILEASYFRVNPDCSGPTWVQGINELLPGPEIRVKRYDRLQVTLVNRLPTESLAIHWHGFRHKESQEYDGALSITMCGIEPGTSFTYDFIVDEPPGSYHYGHAAPGHVAARGLFGPLIVEDDGEPGQNLTFDRDITISLFDWWPESMQHLGMRRQAYLSRPDTQSPQGNDVGLREFHNILINGKGIYNAFGKDFGYSNCTDVSDLFQVVGSSGETLRLRVMNLGAVYALRFRMDAHRFRIIQADGVDVEPYLADAVTMGVGERFDLSVSMDQEPGSYWIRVETLEGHGVHHGQLGILRYEETPEAVEPSLGFPRMQQIGGGLVTLNCVDQEPISANCRPITDLQRVADSAFDESDFGATEISRQIEINVRSFRGNSPGEFTRIVDGANTFDNQLEGNYVQFHRPNVPYSHVEGQDGEHPNTLSVKVSLGETVRMVLQWQDRVAHSWHLHGHKFVVLGVFAPDYNQECDILYCRSDSIGWLNRDGLPSLLDPQVAPVKDTISVPAGGWAVIQFKANNPGWWLLGSQTHLHEGMGVILIEGEGQMPERLQNISYLEDRGFPSCKDQLDKLERDGKGFSCSCWQDPDMKIDNMPLSTYSCSNRYLCDSLTELDGLHSWKGNRERDLGRTSRVGLAIVEMILAILLPVFKEFMHRRAREGADAWKEATSEIRLGEVGESLGQFSVDLDMIDKKKIDGSGKNNMLRSYSNAMANLAEDQTALVRYAVPISFQTTVVNRASTLDLQGELPTGSLCCVIGRHEETNAWLSFFGGRKHQNPHLTIEGNLVFNGIPASKWKADELHQLRCFVQLRDADVWGTLTAFQVLATSFNLLESSYIFPEQQLFQQVALVKLFKLEEYVRRPMADLSDEIRLRIQIVKQCMYSRGLLVLKNPLENLDQQAAKELMRLLSFLAGSTGMTVILSGLSSFSGSEGFPASHILWVPENMPPIFGKLSDLAEYCEDAEVPVPATSNTVAWCAEIVMKGSMRFWPRSACNKLERKEANLDALSKDIPLRCRKNFFMQCFVLFNSELAYAFEESVTIYKFLEIFGVAICTGLVWFGKFSESTETALGESVAFIFFTINLFTIAPVFQALAASPIMLKRVSEDFLNGFCNIYAFVIANVMANLIARATWCAFWQSLAFAFVDVGDSWLTIFLMHIVIILNFLVMHAVGMILGLIIPNPLLNTVVGNMFAQFCLLSNGFYTKLPSWLRFITVISVPRYTFRALLKLEYRWYHSFVVHPNHGVQRFGYPTKYIPAELTMMFQTMFEREMLVMQSPLEPGVASDVGTLAGIWVFLVFVFAATLHQSLSIQECHYHDSEMEAQVTGVARIANMLKGFSGESAQRRSVSEEHSPEISVCVEPSEEPAEKRVELAEDTFKEIGEETRICIHQKEKSIAPKKKVTTTRLSL